MMQQYTLHKLLILGSCALLGPAIGCGDAASDADDAAASPYASEVVDFVPGEGSGHGRALMPEPVLGAPDGAQREEPAAKPSQVLSLGAGGEIVLGFERPIADGPGADFIVFENAFYVQGDPAHVWAELGEVSVSADGETWHTFTCDAEPAEPGQWPGCAGWTPTEVFDADTLVPLDPEVTGGDAFDLADLGVDSARYVRIRDMLEETNSEADNVGFDLDAVGVVHFE